MTNFDNEPGISLDDTQPPQPKTIDEPEIKPDDTQPRPPVVSEFVRADAPIDDEEERPGCNKLLVGTVTLAFLCLIVSAIGLAALAGYRDGANDAQARKAAALVGTVGAQATLAKQDCREGRYELCSARCVYIVTAQPAFPGMPACLATAQIGMSATPIAAATNTPTAVPTTATPALSTAEASGGFSREELFVRAQEAMRINEYETTVKWLEALRGLDADYRRKEVEDTLVTAYQALGTRYQNEGRLSEMIVVIQKALKIRPLTGTAWEFTINAAQLYLDGKGFLASGDIVHADAAFQKLIAIAPTYLDTKSLACQAFAAAGNTKFSQQYCS